MNVRGRTSVASIAALVVIALACTSAALGLESVFRELRAIDRAYGSIGSYEAERAGAYRFGVDVQALDLFRAGVDDSDRYYLLVGERAPFQHRDGAVALPLYTRYWLAPARQVESPAEATVVLAYGADPRRLRLRYSSIESQPTGFAVARVIR